ncbi:MAG TPA: hypothetical protein VN436_12155, partial [Holophaga sp.]|nr:hypothetical protein [Holophaga sp.]
SQAMGASRRLEGMVEAAGVLMQLATGELTRAEILRAASHPVLAGRWQGLDPDAWPGLCERAGIVARLDAAETAGTYLEGGTWTWDQGLTRMALGCFMREEATPGFFPVSGTEAPGLVASLGALTADLRYLAQGRLPVGAWLDRLERVLQTYLLPAPERAEEGEAEAFARLVKALEGLRSLETAPLPPPVLDFQAFRALAAGALASARADHALPLGRGVQVGCYTPLRAIPYKVMILLGLGEGLFPAADRPDPMDLLAESPRRAGDVGASERDRYLFLEAVLSARQNLVVTYPSQDVLTGEALQPSPLLLDLAEVLGPEAWSTVRLPEQPRHRHDPAAFPHLAPQGTAIPCHHREAREEAELRHLGQALRAQAGGRDLPWRLLRQGPGPLVRALGPRLSLATPLAPEPPALPGRIRVTLAQLKRWLECPVQGGEAIRLGIRSIDDEDPAELVQEPLDTGALERHGLLREAFWRHVAAQEPLEDAYRMVRAAREARAQVPRGPMAEGEQASHLAQLETWRQQLPEGPGCVLHRFGSAPVDGALPVEDHPPLDLELTLGGKAHTVRLEGLSAPEQDGTFLLLTTRAIASLAKEPAPSDRDQRQMLAAWLAHLALCAQGEVQERKARLQSAAPKKAAVVETAFPCLSQEEARAQLETWLEEIFAEPPPRRLMPIEALLAKTPVKDLREFVDGKDDGDDVPELACFRGPVPRAKDLETEPDLSEGERRLQGFLAIAFSWRSL